MENYNKDIHIKSCPGTLFTNQYIHMALKELYRDIHGGYYFIKDGDNGKQKFDFNNPKQATALLLTAITREFGIKTLSDSDLNNFKDKKYVS
jgi:hypothetical protein